MKDQRFVAILLATYRPRLDWLAELLDSLNAQSYPALHLFVRDDSADAQAFETVRAALDEHITEFSYTLAKNEENLGSNKTFEALVKDARGMDYIAFCDQDDVWMPDKIARTVSLMEESSLHPTMVCTNLLITDGNGNEIAPRMEVHRKRHVFLRGNDVAPTLIYRNFAMGCTMLLDRERALSYLPIPDDVVHDHYLAYRAACDGAIDYLDTPTIRYRVYGGNQTGVMTGVNTKEDYKRLRIDLFNGRVAAFAERTDLPALKEALAWGQARVDFFERKKGSWSALWRLRKVNKPTTLFELFALRSPNLLFRLAIRLVQRRIL